MFHSISLYMENKSEVVGYSEHENGTAVNRGNYSNAIHYNDEIHKGIDGDPEDERDSDYGDERDIHDIEDEYTTFFNIISREIDKVECDPRRSNKYLGIQESEAEDLKINFPDENLTLCRIFTGNMNEVKEMISHNADDMVAEGDKQQLRPTSENAASSDDHALGSLKKRFQFNYTGSGFPRLLIDKADIDIEYVSMLFFLYSMEKPGFRAMEMADRVHDFRANKILPNTFNSKVTDSLKLWPSPVIKHRTYGMHEAAYIPLIQFMLSSERFAAEPLTDWTVLFHVNNDLLITNPFPSDFLLSLQKKMNEIGSEISKILIVVNIQLGSNYGQGHVLTFLINRGNSMDTAFITILDRLWVQSDHREYNKIYIERMVQIIETLGILGMKMALSGECLKWMNKKRRTLLSQGLTVDSFFDDEKFIKHETLSLPWLSYILENEILLRHTKSEAMICPFDAALYIVSCIQASSIGTDYNMHSIFENVFNLTEKLNVELSISILSGYFILSPASVQRALCSLNSMESMFYVIDCNKNTPSNTYAWAIGLNFGEAGPKIFALRHDPGYDANFHWERRFYRHGGPDESYTLLNKLKQGALSIADIQTSETFDGKKRMIYSGEIDQCMFRTKGNELKAALTIINSLLGIMTLK